MTGDQVHEGPSVELEPDAAEVMRVVQSLRDLFTGPPVVKPGWRTTEFALAGVLPWIVVVLDNAQVVSLTPASWRWVLPVIAAVANGLYANGRGHAKSQAPLARQGGA